MLPFWSRFAGRRLRPLKLPAHAFCSCARSHAVVFRTLPSVDVQSRRFVTQATSADSEKPQRYGPLDVDLQPRDQLRPLLPTWNPPPTRPPKPEELEVSTRLRFLFEDRWWAASIREMGDNGRIRVAFDGWPSRHDEWVQNDSDRLCLHESVHPDYVAPPLPKRYQRPVPTDADGNPLPPTPRPPRPRAFDPEKERLKRSLRPPLPYNPEKERLKRVLRGQYVPPLEEPQEQTEGGAPDPWLSHDISSAAQSKNIDEVTDGASGVTEQTAQKENPSVSNQGAATDVARTAPSAPPPPGPPPETVEWLEIPGGVDGVRAFRHALDGKVHKGPPPSGWVELLAAERGSRYYWHVGRNVTQWEKPK